MSRAINVNATQAEVVTACRKHGATISAIETLVSGGTRVVLTNGDAAAIMKAAFGRKVLAGVGTLRPRGLRRSPIFFVRRTVVRDGFDFAPPLLTTNGVIGSGGCLALVRRGARSRRRCDRTRDRRRRALRFADREIVPARQVPLHRMQRLGVEVGHVPGGVIAE